MGYRRPRKQYRLTFDNPEFAGLEVLMDSLSVGELDDLVAASQDVRSGHVMEALIASKLIAWNLEDEDGTPVPGTVEGVRSQDIDLMRAIVAAWMGAVADVAPPLPNGSANGVRHLEASIPMAPFSPSPVN